MNLVDEIRQNLIIEAEEEYKIFSSSLLPNVNNILGVRLPKLRKFSKVIIKENWQEYLNFEPKFFEEIMLQGFVIGLLDIDFKDILEFIEMHIPKITNWSLCDSFCCSLKKVNVNKERFWEFLQRYFKSKEEYEARFAYVMALNFYVEEKYLNSIFAIINNFDNQKYYAKMAVAWLVSVCFVKFPRETENFLMTTKIDKETFNKSIQKIIESKQINKDLKCRVKSFKKF